MYLHRLFCVCNHAHAHIQYSIKNTSREESPLGSLLIPHMRFYTFVVIFFLKTSNPVTNAVDVVINHVTG